MTRVTAPAGTTREVMNLAAGRMPRRRMGKIHDGRSPEEHE